MAKVPSKGTVLQQEISSVFTAVAQLTEISQGGIKSETYDATTLDTSGAGKEYSQTGYSEGGTVDISPVVALIILEVVRRILVSILAGL